MSAAYRSERLAALVAIIATLMVSNVALATGDSGGAVRNYESGNSPSPWPFFDFKFGQYKAECVSGGTIVGISRHVFGEAPISILCESLGTPDTLFYQGSTTPGAEENDETFSSSNSAHYNTHGGDWDVGYYKGECPVGSMAIGIGQTTDSSHQVNTIHCSSTTGQMCSVYHQAYRPNTTCHTLTVVSGSNVKWGNWETDEKTSCGAGEVVQGVSADTTNHHPHAILCCAAPLTVC